MARAPWCGEQIYSGGQSFRQNCLHRSDLDDSLAEFLRRACASDRDKDFNTAAEMETELRKVRAGL
ncbi:hypothetical protein AYO39_00230 [Actinobacteria bacterium SCGC AG-212-D09]|nr:hypothetical protein AYO39_00230 [Actinobacteria bacterium SCGC AG-212-D09]